MCVISEHSGALSDLQLTLVAVFARSAGYIPAIWPAALFAALFAILAFCSWIHYARQRALVWLPIGHTAMTVGFVRRSTRPFRL